MLNSGFTAPLDAEDFAVLRARALEARGAVLTATTLAASGHPGGSFSSMEIYTLLWGSARVRPEEPRWTDRDRIVVSHGHTSPGVYTALAGAGYFPTAEVEAHFRQAGSIFEGHVERSVPGVEWSTGNLGQGLSAGVGFALGARATSATWHTIVAMSDGEQHKGQVSEARRLAVKEGLGNLTAIVDWNHVQISGHTAEVMPVPIAEDWAADGWRVYECDGHDLEALHTAISRAAGDGVPSVVLAHTVIGKTVSFMEDEPEFHGRGLSRDEYSKAMTELGLDDDALARAVVARALPCAVEALEHTVPALVVSPGERREYTGTSSDNRGAWGKALTDIATLNDSLDVMVLDCDLAVSVKTEAFAAAYPERFVQCGVGEHNTAAVAGALSSVPGILSFWADFGVFGIDEVYNQQRLNDINGAALKLVVTHCGLDVGEDGKTHQCLDYVGALRNFFGWKVVVPADPNQTDAAVRAMASMPGNVALAVGRSKLPAITGADGGLLFSSAYAYRYGDMVWAREGSSACIVTMGTVAGAAVAASDMLRADGIDAAVAITASPLALDADGMRVASAAPWLFSAEDHNARTGLGASIAEWLADNGVATRFARLGVSEYQSSGAAKDLFAHVGLDAEGIARSVRERLMSR